MGRRGVNSSRVTGRGSLEEKTFDVLAVAPIVLFPVTEEDKQIDNRGSEVMYMWIFDGMFLLCIQIANFYQG